MGQYLEPSNDPKQKSKKRRTDKVEGHGESTHEDKVNEVSSDEKCSVVWLIKLVRKQFKCFFFDLPNKHFSMYVTMKPLKEWTSVKSFLFLFFVKVIAPHPSASVGKQKQNTERTQPIDGEKNDGGQLLQKPKPTQPTDSKNNEMSQVVEVIKHENKKKWGSSYINLP